MGVFTAKSKIEFYRKRRHGTQSRFRFLRDSEQGYRLIAELTAKFFVNRKFDTNIGANVEYLVVDAAADFPLEEIQSYAHRGDLVSADGTYKRYNFDTQTRPTALIENRYRFLISPVFNDETPIVSRIALTGGIASVSLVTGALLVSSNREYLTENGNRLTENGNRLYIV